jgi:hypothetical protein
MKQIITYFFLMLKHPVSVNYDTKNTNIFQLFHCQHTQSFLITLYQWRLVRVGKVGTAYPDFAKDINLFKLKFINKYNLITLKCNF